MKNSGCYGLFQFVKERCCGKTLSLGALVDAYQIIMEYTEEEHKDAVDKFGDEDDS